MLREATSGTKVTQGHLDFPDFLRFGTLWDTLQARARNVARFDAHERLHDTRQVAKRAQQASAPTYEKKTTCAS